MVVAQDIAAATNMSGNSIENHQTRLMDAFILFEWMENYQNSIK